MPPSSLSRSAVTARLLTELKTEGFPVGDNNDPEDDYGWQGEPNSPSASFIPWMALTPGPARLNTPPGAMGDTGGMWIATYNVLYAGISRAQCEALADRMRKALHEIARESLTTQSGNWRVMKVSCNGIGSNNRVGGTFPDYSTQSDSFEVWLTKEG